MTWRAYETDLDTRLQGLHDRVHRGSYRAQPSKRAYIPKADGRLGPLETFALAVAMTACSCQVSYRLRDQASRSILGTSTKQRPSAITSGRPGLRAYTRCGAGRDS